jgi:hypothetical protein
MLNNTPVTWLILSFSRWLTTCYLSPLSLLFYFEICVRIVFQTDERSVNFPKGLYIHDYTPQYVLETVYFTSCSEEKSWSMLWDKLLMLSTLRFTESE